ncbi:MAG TPA: FxsA family protein [Solirubrobacteraceae bacterium]|jgi:UPF0716 protein FxsA|nr:FxsA family protein [Solirubrobacteraceae bacterium]
MFVLVLIGVPALELFVFIEVGRTIGWLPALVLLIGTSVFGIQTMRLEGRAALARVSLAISDRRAPARAAIDGALGFLGGVLLVVPGFVTDAIGVLLLLPASRRLVRRWISRHYAARVIDFVTATVRFAPGGRRAAGYDRFGPNTPGVRPADVESTAFEDDLDELGP